MTCIADAGMFTMFERTEAFLKEHPHVWDDSGFALEYGENPTGRLDIDAMRQFFGEGKHAQSRGGHMTYEVKVARATLLQISRTDGPGVLLDFLVEDLHNTSWRTVERSVLQELVGIYFSEMDSPVIFINHSVPSSGGYMIHKGPENSSVTNHSWDNFICMVDAKKVAYWVDVSDE
ncbi:hypothetical protein DES53_106351 [Roseimicrobium gellanilyticum]|uniref:Uncharacterized protein n=1 Tax=Roseimicrobium gellanilyticum TaxID=748857 RepID=A0A366HJ02_9BACT|nr:hypothetical protein [Roseimicrobium gellanilyticum]RBP42642.1 hypothetical protein DES53_106351 [Roseimicrobium gellanilyticum]